RGNRCEARDWRVRARRFRVTFLAGRSLVEAMKTIDENVDGRENDAWLVERCRTGEKNAYGSLVSRYKRMVCSLTYSATGDLQRSEELAQETFVTAWK